MRRDVPVDTGVLRAAAVRSQLAIRQWLFVPRGLPGESVQPLDAPAQAAFERRIYDALLVIEEQAYTDPQLAGLYPLSLSSATQVLKGLSLIHI